MKRRNKKYNNEVYENGVVVIKYKNFEQQFDYMNRLCHKYAKVVHVPEEKKFMCSGCKLMSSRYNKRETFNEYASRFGEL